MAGLLVEGEMFDPNIAKAAIMFWLLKLRGLERFGIAVELGMFDELGEFGILAELVMFDPLEDAATLDVFGRFNDPGRFKY